MKLPHTQAAHHRPIGLLIMTEHEGKTIALLRKRPLKDIRLKPVEWPNVCGLTVNGPPCLSPLSTLVEMVKRELGKDGAIANWAVKNLPYSCFNKSGHIDGPSSNEAWLFTAYMPHNIVSMITLNVDGGEIISITAEDVDHLIPAKKAWKHQPHNQSGIVILPNLLESIRVGFKTFENDKRIHDKRESPSKASVGP